MTRGGFPLSPAWFVGYRLDRGGGQTPATLALSAKQMFAHLGKFDRRWSARLTSTTRIVCRAIGPFNASFWLRLGPKILSTASRSFLVSAFNAIVPSHRLSDQQPLAITISCLSQAKWTHRTRISPFMWRTFRNGDSALAGTKTSLFESRASWFQTPAKMRC